MLLAGRSHDKSFALFRVGVTASDGLKTFCETGQSDGLEAQSQGEGGVFDEFNGPAISTGQGNSRTEFFVDGNHTKVSVAVRIVPSPDWFVGLDSLELCKNGFWIDALSVQAGPMDAGTDSGFTFTAPNWPSEPRQKISHITAQEPSHPANSFHYPDKKRLPPIATFHFHKDKVYRLSEETRHSPNDIQVYTVDDLEAVLRQDDISNDVLPSIVHEQTQRPKLNKHRRMRKGARRAVACQVGEWETWSPCSVSCGIGESVRSRQVLKRSRRGGQPCPPLTETKWCGEHTACPQRFFNW
ncbi:Spondin-2 [Zootermopsis nevadensis]|uniref:Spondin-2 n=1 Tax=Zootermopsis nevadensis TaxID=136037 RepID=A0A067QZH6_ZOONE|nr:Spondin-2 [Zootermopsis nevadensis]